MTFALIISTRNRADALRRCLAALDVAEIREQSGHVVIVDNGSTDDTQDVIRAQQRERFGDLLTMVVEPRPGLSHARNAGVGRARGDILVFTDDDCYVQPGFFRELLREFGNGQLDYCTGRILLHDPTDARRCVNYSTQRYELPPRSFLATGDVQGANMAFHRRVFDRIGLFDTMFGAGTAFPCEDIDFAARASHAGFRGAFLPQLVVHHHHGRKPGSPGLAATMRSYDLGRGAYYTSRLLDRDWKYIGGWVRATIEKRRSPQNLYFEMVGVIGYLRARLSRGRTQHDPTSAELSNIGAPAPTVNSVDANARRSREPIRGVTATNNLIFDVGMHEGQDTGYYLNRGYRVVAVDADPRLIERAKVVFADALHAGRLTLVCCAVSGNEQDLLDFHLSERSIWSSTNKAVSTRENVAVQTVQVQGRRLPDLFTQYGVPLYCKIDIEGMDAACLRTLKETADLPRYISVETECIGDRDELTEAQALETLDELQRLGYTRFKLVDQTSLLVLSPSTSIYRERPSLWQRALRRLPQRTATPYNYWEAVDANRARLNTAHQYEFPKSASGPFGADLDGRWLNADAARATLRRHRREYFRMPDAKRYGFWCDWHATR